MIGTLNIANSECRILRKSFGVAYEPSKKYLGRNNTLPKKVKISLTMFFETDTELEEYFTFWEDETDRGAKPFYVKLPVYGVPKHYLVLQDGDISQKHNRTWEVSGTYTLYTSRTLDENNPPVFDPKTSDIDMDSTNNYILFQSKDYDEVAYTIETQPLHGVITSVGGGAFYYTPTDSFSGTDTVVVKATDSVGAETLGTLSINVINWKLNEEFKLTMDANGHLYIDYVNTATLDPLIMQAVDELSLGGINNDGEYVITLPTTHIDTLTQTANDEWLITPK